MSSIVVCGGGLVGLGVAMMLAADGHEVTVLERDGAEGPADGAGAWDGWARPGVAQFHQPHWFMARFREVCDEELPGLTDRMTGAGCVRLDQTAALPPSLADRGPRPGDERLVVVTGRRPVVEAVFSAAALDAPGVTMRRGVKIAGLVSGVKVIPGVPHVTGVRAADGEEFAADLVVDATGRTTASAEWLVALGGRPPLVESQDRGFVYYTRYFTGPAVPAQRGPLLFPLGTISMLTLCSDNHTWSVTIFGRSDDAAIKAVRDPDVFARVVASCPLTAHWLDGEPLGGVYAMAGILDRYRRFAVDGVPVATGFAAVGDAWACTNPSVGRGLSVGFVHAQLLRRTLADHGDDPAMFAEAWDAATEAVVTPFFRNQAAADGARLAEMTALRRGEPAPPPNPAVAGLWAAAATDAGAFRGVLEIANCLAQPQDVLARPEIRELIAGLGAAELPKLPGPDRAQLLALLTN